MMKKIPSLIVLAVFASFAMSACNNNTVQEHDHVWDEGEVTKEPDCHTEGVRTFKCTVEGCQQTKIESIAMTPHTWDEGVITTPPTCSETGVMTYSCTNEGCDKTKTVVLEKTEHNYSIESIHKIPDLLVSGDKEHKCSICGDTTHEEIKAHADYSEQYDNEAFAWHYQSLNTYAPTDTDITPNPLVKDGEVY